MALGARLQLRQSQSLVMTPQLMQSIRLLQFTHAELERFIDEEIERNPLLERAPDDGRAAHGAEEPDWPDATGAGSQGSAGAREIADRLDSSLENLFPDDTGRSDALRPDLLSQWRSAGGSGIGGSADGFDLDEFAAQATTLREHLGAQIAMTFSDAVEHAIASHLADAVDEAGYCRAEIAEVAGRLGVSATQVERVLAACQQMEPAGVFARDLAECLALQLRVRDRYDPAMAALVAHLDLLARRDFQALKRLCGVDEEDLLDMLAEIRLLDPKPGTLFSAGSAQTVVPDVIVTPSPDGSWAVEVNPATLPRVLVDQAYFARVSKTTRDPAEKEFMAECLQNANWLTRSLDQRARTIVKVASEIVRQQDGFLVEGVRKLRPLNLKTVAQAIGMHESTVSRVTANKFMLTPRGVFELRFFFTASIAASGGGEAHSAEAVRDRIRAMIDAEAPDAVLSDDAIVDMLAKDRIDIARRTVAKYREALNIPSSVRRRREKQAMAGVGR
ncbi:MAG: RNA polymerase factor sigma-54 [Rhizobiaceae bacterium]|nr:RNA polymerase factor sigma-54 [Rhizobiaceae bacterium]MCV0405003.1 RNA polymerase factor sigma-54 [Rhizobiaceae bacterium]